MSNDLKTQLIKLGTTSPELRPHIREVLASINKESSSIRSEWFEGSPPSKQDLSRLTNRWGYIPGIVKVAVTGDVTEYHWVVIDAGSSRALDMPVARAEKHLVKIALNILNQKFSGDWNIKPVAVNAGYAWVRLGSTNPIDLKNWRKELRKSGVLDITAEEFKALKPTLIGQKGSVRYYEDPHLGDEGTLISVQGNKVVRTDDYDMP